jgi:hypothetical protein
VSLRGIAASRSNERPSARRDACWARLNGGTSGKPTIGISLFTRCKGYVETPIDEPYPFPLTVPPDSWASVLGGGEAPGAARAAPGRAKRGRRRLRTDGRGRQPGPSYCGWTGPDGGGERHRDRRTLNAGERVPATDRSGAVRGRSAGAGPGSGASQQRASEAA